MKPKFVDYYMKIADTTAELSYAKRRRVGAVIVRENQILATGYNGMPSGWENNCEGKEYKIDGHYIDDDGCYDLVTKQEVLHAESNAIAKVARSTESSEGATLFCTTAPCIECAKLIYQSGIKSVYYRDAYRNTDGLNFLKQSDVNVHQYPNSLQD